MAGLIAWLLFSILCVLGVLIVGPVAAGVVWALVTLAVIVSQFAGGATKGIGRALDKLEDYLARDKDQK